MNKVIINNQELNMDTLNEYLLCDATTISEVFKDVEPFVDLTITSPPYYDALIYSNKENQVGFQQTYQMYLNDIRKVFQGVYDISKDNSTLYLNIDNLVRQKMKRNFEKEESNSLKGNKFSMQLDDSNINYYLTHPTLIKKLQRQGILDIRLDIAEILFDIGFDVRAIIIWDKCKTLPLAKQRIPGKIYRHEYILYAVKGECGRFNENYRRLPNGEYNGSYVHYCSNPDMWEYNDVFLNDRTEEWINNPENFDPYGEQSGTHIRYLIPTQNKYTFKHPCPFPPKLIAHLIKTSTTEGDEVIFDPFGGTGMVKAVAGEMGYKALTLDISKESQQMHYDEIIPYVKKKMVDINKYFKEHETLLPQYTQSIFELQVTKYLTMLSDFLNMELREKNILLYATDYNTFVPVDGDKLNVNLTVGLDNLDDTDIVKSYIDSLYNNLGPGYFEFTLNFVKKDDILNQFADAKTELALYMGDHLNPLVVDLSIDDIGKELLNDKTVFCSDIIIGKDKYQHLLPRKNWR